MKYLALIVAGIFLTTASISQTKKIALKSHSGTYEDFDINNSGNIGLNEPRYYPKSKVCIKVDTVSKKAMIHDSVATYNFLLKHGKTKPAKKNSNEEKKGEESKEVKTKEKPQK